MKTLFLKEIRLLLPALFGALALAILPIWLLPYDHWNPSNFPTYLYVFGTLLLALSSFGREISLRTLPFILAQPLERARLWWVKVTVLFLSLLVVFDAWMSSGSLHSLIEPEQSLSLGMLGVAAFFVAVFTAGGLWLTLLLRQTAAAFWLSLLIPLATMSAVKLVGGPDWLVLAALGIYAAAAFFLARWQFLRVQDTAWTGGVLMLSGGQADGERGEARESRPWAALFWKELQLHQMTLVGVACLVALHLAVVLLRKVGINVLGKTILSALEMFGGLWLIVPFLAGSQSVADERQLGTLDTLLCLPVSRRIQFALKMLFVLAIGGLLSAMLLCLIESLANAIGAGANVGIMGISFGRQGFAGVALAFMLLSLIGLFASTLSRGMVPGLATGVVTALVFFALAQLALGRALPAFGNLLWPKIVFPTLCLTMLWLAYANFRFLFESGRCWRRNLLALICALALTFGASAAVYHRVWELALPPDLPHGPAKLPVGQTVSLSAVQDYVLVALLPDGRLWRDEDMENAARHSTAEDRFVPGSDWISAAATPFEPIGIRADGTLWASEFPGRVWVNSIRPKRPLVQVGTEKDWHMVARVNWGQVILLKRDGTLWSFVPDKNPGAHQPVRNHSLARLGEDSDWARILPAAERVYAWKQDGSAWIVRNDQNDPTPQEKQLGLKMIATPVPALNNMEFSSLITFWVDSHEVGVRKDGTLWYWNWSEEVPAARWAKFWPRRQQSLRGVKQIGTGSDWAAVAGGYERLLALKTDGSMWMWELSQLEERDGIRPFANAPVRLGTHSDLVGLASWNGEMVALSADGNLWRWQRSDEPVPWREEDALLLPPRRPTKIENIFPAAH